MIFVFIALLQSCVKQPTELSDPTPLVNDHHFNLTLVPYAKLYKNQSWLYITNNMYPQDSNGVYLFLINGEYYYHPVAICHRSLEALNDYSLTHDQTYLDHAIISMETLRTKALRYEGMLYFPYLFDCPETPTLIYKAPWYSGMAQGMALSAYSRLYHFTQEPLYRAVADSILTTLTDFTSPYSVVHITDETSLLQGAGYYSIDEYPGLPRRYVLNGSIIGSMGLYDHWWVFRDTHSKELFSKALTSFKDRVILYRNPGEMSAYCLYFRVRNLHYHKLHQTLLRHCLDMTGDDYFGKIADRFYSDYHERYNH